MNGCFQDKDRTTNRIPIFRLGNYARPLGTLRFIARALHGDCYPQITPIAQIKYKREQTTLEEKTIRLLATLLDCSESVQSA